MIQHGVYHNNMRIFYRGKYSRNQLCPRLQPPFPNKDMHNDYMVNFHIILLCFLLTGRPLYHYAPHSNVFHIIILLWVKAVFHQAKFFDRTEISIVQIQKISDQFHLSACKTKENFDSDEKFRLVENRLKNSQREIYEAVLWQLDKVLALE